MCAAVHLKLGTRTSDLALWQTRYVMDRLRVAWPNVTCEEIPYITVGDQTQAAGKPLPAIGGKGLFTAELEESLRSGAIDLAVHSLKDLPVEDSPGLTLGAIPSRADVRDALVARNGWTLDTLPNGAIVGTSSTRRAAQLLALRPDLVVRSIRGNVPTRARKVRDGEYDATLLAVAGLTRLGLDELISEILPLERMLPAPGQGALGVQCRADDQQTLALLSALDDADVRATVTAERAFLHALGGGCSAPVAAHATFAADQSLHLDTLVGSTDGQTVIRIAKRGGDGHSAEAFGESAATAALAQGADALLRQAQAPSSLKMEPTPAGMAASLPNRAQPLHGKRIVVTRAQEQAASLVDALSALGADVLAIPTIRIEPLPDLSQLDRALQRLDRYRWIIFTSVNGVAVFAERMAAQGAALPAGVQVAAVGESTADALRAVGIQPSFVPVTYIAEAIVNGVRDVGGAAILLPQAEIARDTLRNRLADRGAQVDAIPIYQTLPAPLSADALAALRQGVDLLTFTSGSTVRNLHDALKDADAQVADMIFANATIACIGPVTAETAQELGLQVAIVAQEHTIEGLVAAIVDYCK